MKNRIKYILLLLIPIGMLMSSCDDESSYPDTSAYETVIYGIKIINGGKTGSETIIGTVNENTKEITFPDIDPEADLSSINFEAELSEGALLDEEKYDFSISEGDTKIKRTIAVVNGLRKREYFVTIQLDVPVYGADFSADKVKAYDFSGRSSIYPDLAAYNTRSVDMDENYVLMVSRDGGIRPHLLKIADLKQGVSTNPILLNTTDVSGGIFPLSAGRLAQGHIYICNLATPSETAPIKIYHWASAEAEPELVASILSTDLAGYSAGRFGDYMSVDIDEDGNGYIYLGVNPGQSEYKVLKMTVVGFTNVSEPTLVNISEYGGYWACFNPIDEAPGNYIYTGHQGPIMLVNANGQSLYTVSTSSIPVSGGSDARVITFNQERYLAMIATPGTGSIDVYDITKGSTVAEALAIFEEGDKTPLYQYSLGGNIAASVAAGSFNWTKDGDDTLYLMGAAPKAGFVVLEIPKKVKE